MKFYFAARTRHKDMIKEVIGDLINKNHEISFDWTILEDLTPFNQNQDKCKKTAENISMALNDTDVFVLISDLAGTDMFVELGIAIANFMSNNKPKIYIVGEHNKRSLMHLHPSVIHVDDLEEVFVRENI